MILFEHRFSENYRLDICLKGCLGFGWYSSKQVFSKFGFNLRFKNNKIRSLNLRFKKDLDVLIVKRTIDLLSFCVGVERKNRILLEMKKVRNGHSYKSIRHYQNLPVRGQRTATNARTQKSKRGFRRGLPIALKKKV